VDYLLDQRRLRRTRSLSLLGLTDHVSAHLLPDDSGRSRSCSVSNSFFASKRPNMSIRRETRPVHPVWWLAPSPAPFRRGSTRRTGSGRASVDLPGISSSPVDRTPAIGAAQEGSRQPALDLLRHLKQRHVPAGTGWTLHLEFIAIEGIKTQQRPDDQHIDGHPHGTPPVGVPSEHSRIGFRRQILHLYSWLPTQNENGWSR